MQNNWGNFCKVAFFAICEIFFAVQKGMAQSGPMLNTPVCKHRFISITFVDWFYWPITVVAKKLY